MEIVNENSLPVTYVGRGRRNKYKWDEWLVPNQTSRITRGVDFEIHSSTMIPQIYNAAARRDGAVEVKRGRDTKNREIIDITFTSNIPTLTDEELDEDLFPQGIQSNDA